MRRGTTKYSSSAKSGGSFRKSYGVVGFSGGSSMGAPYMSGGYGGKSYTSGGVGYSAVSFGGGGLGQCFIAATSGGSSSASGGLVTNEKETMINLNNRLSAYLQKVKDLESSNTKLELQLKEFQVGKAISGVDYAAYDALIKPLRDQILSIHLGNARLALDLDNATLAAKDFNNKFENEFVIKQSVEADIAELRALKDEYIRNYKDLENDIVSSQEELAYLKKNHEEELIVLRQQVTGTVSVDVSSGPNIDLALLLAQIREEYEKICKQNQADAEVWYKKQIETQTVQTVQVNEAAENAKLQITELRRQSQTLQAEYDSLFSGNCSLEASIQEVDDSYAQKLYGLKSSISQMEAEMISLRDSIIQKAKDYENLLDIKMKLEMEIATYRKLLEGIDIREDLTTTDSRETSGSTTTTTTRVETRTVIE